MQHEVKLADWVDMSSLIQWEICKYTCRWVLTVEWRKNVDGSRTGRFVPFMGYNMKGCTFWSRKRHALGLLVRCRCPCGSLGDPSLVMKSSDRPTENGLKKKIRIDRGLCVGAHPLWGTLSRRGLNPIKLAYNPSRPNGRLRFWPTPLLTDWVSVPTVLVTGSTATQNSPFLP